MATLNVYKELITEVSKKINIIDVENFKKTNNIGKVLWFSPVDIETEEDSVYYWVNIVTEDYLNCKIVVEMAYSDLPLIGTTESIYWESENMPIAKIKRLLKDKVFGTVELNRFPNDDKEFVVKVNESTLSPCNMHELGIEIKGYR